MENDNIQNKIQARRAKYLSRIQGSLLAGAAGDAMGCSVKFLRYRDIRQAYGPGGIVACELTDGMARISDETQLTLFTANGLLYGETCVRLQGVGREPYSYIPHAYEDWYYTQEPAKRPSNIISWLASLPELFSQRGPGMTCVSALRSGKTGSVSRPLNNSCGCGGVVRTAPIGLFYGQDYENITPGDIVRIGAETAAITHGHPLGYIPGGMLSLVVFRAAFSDAPLDVIVESSLADTKQHLGTDKYWNEFETLIRKAVDLAASPEDHDVDNIHSLGEGRLGHEALAAAVYAALRHRDDLSAALIAAVNHDGTSDCAGSMCGNILGAYLGSEHIAPEWTEHLELRDVILEIGRDLCDHCQMTKDGTYDDPDWRRKYVDICGLNTDQ